jgi:hypothetical protein
MTATELQQTILHTDWHSHPKQTYIPTPTEHAFAVISVGNNQFYEQHAVSDVRHSSSSHYTVEGHNSS